MSEYSPIALFVYNRIKHTRITIDALKANTDAEFSELYIFSDGNKSDRDYESVKNVRNYIKNVNGFKSVKIIERDRNYGLAESIVDGVSLLCKKYGRAIVLEDDLITSKYFLNYMNSALNEYKDEYRVMHISGYMFQVKAKDLPATFFIRPTTCWGWATWNRAWSKYSKNPVELIKSFTEEDKKEFNMENSYDYWSQVLMNANGEINTWAVFWYASVFKENGLSLHPSISMVRNIGHDGSGTNCNETRLFDVKLENRKISVNREKIAENKLAREATIFYFQSIKPVYWRRFFNFLKRYIKASFPWIKND